jgi:hypothetical protein
MRSFEAKLPVIGCANTTEGARNNRRPGQECLSKLVKARNNPAPWTPTFAP